MSKKSILVMPRVNANDDSGLLVRWLKSAGEAVQPGELVAQIETTKAAVDIEANDHGFLRPLALAGTKVAVGQPIAWIVDADDPADAATEPIMADAPVVSASEPRLVSRKAQELLDRSGLTPEDIPGAAPISERQVQMLLAQRDNNRTSIEIDMAAALPVPENAVVLFGASHQGVVVLDTLQAGGTFMPFCFVDENPKLSEVGGYRVFSLAVLDTLLRRGIKLLHVCIGSPKPKLRLAAELREKGFTLINAIHPRAVIARSARLGEGIYVGPGAVIGPLAEIGDCCQINNNSTVPHDVKLGEGVRISDGANVAGGVTIGDRSYLGLGVTVNTGCHIGADVTIVSGVSVFDVVPDGALVRAATIRR